MLALHREQQEKEAVRSEVWERATQSTGIKGKSECDNRKREKGEKEAERLRGFKRKEKTKDNREHGNYWLQDLKRI